MASEVISHAIFCLFPSHPTPHRIVFHSASHPTLASHPALRSTSHPASRPWIPLAKSLPPRHSIFLPSTNLPSASLHPPCSSAKPRLWIFSCVKRPGSLTT